MREWVTPQPGHGTPRKWRTKQKCGTLATTGADKQTSNTERKTLTCTRFCSPIGSRFKNHLGQRRNSNLLPHQQVHKNHLTGQDTKSLPVEYRGLVTTNQPHYCLIVCRLIIMRRGRGPTWYSLCRCFGLGASKVGVPPNPTACCHSTCLLVRGLRDAKRGSLDVRS